MLSSVAFSRNRIRQFCLNIIRQEHRPARNYLSTKKRCVGWCSRVFDFVGCAPRTGFRAANGFLACRTGCLARVGTSPTPTGHDFCRCVLGSRSDPAREVRFGIKKQPLWLPSPRDSGSRTFAGGSMVRSAHPTGSFDLETIRTPSRTQIRSRVLDGVLENASFNLGASCPSARPTS
jgi:hypothetical protein